MSFYLKLATLASSCLLPNCGSSLAACVFLPAPSTPGVDTGVQWLMQPTLPSPLPPPEAVAALAFSFNAASNARARTGMQRLPPRFTAPPLLALPSLTSPPPSPVCPLPPVQHYERMLTAHTYLLRSIGRRTCLCIGAVDGPRHQAKISLAIHNLAEAYICASLILYPPASKSAQT